MGCDASTKVLQAVTKSGSCLQWASNKLRADRDVVLAALSHPDSLAWQWASHDLRRDRLALQRHMSEKAKE